ncbi:putative membrane protein [Estrella lausannensis]|uniref:Putative membrane protein n=1 Tax=Estrella lausannensis TaxID=483423 RepID=A0A0H5DN61_9BACT|nr:putative membrane protein [Estrella lausannensis]
MLLNSHPHIMTIPYTAFHILWFYFIELIVVNTHIQIHQIKMIRYRNFIHPHTTPYIQMDQIRKLFKET